MAGTLQRPLAQPLKSGNHNGVPAAGWTAVEEGDGHYHRTTLTPVTTIPAIAGGASLGIGKLAYTFPPGDILVEASKLATALTQSLTNVGADTPDVGLGTTIASGAVAVLGGTAAFENIHTGQTATNVTGTALNSVLGTQLVIKAADSHNVYLNVADGWAASGDPAVALTGQVVLVWRVIAAA